MVTSGAATTTTLRLRRVGTLYRRLAQLGAAQGARWMVGAQKSIARAQYDSTSA